jgi:hypothetical protein
MPDRNYAKVLAIGEERSASVLVIQFGLEYLCVLEIYKNRIDSSLLCHSPQLTFASQSFIQLSCRFSIQEQGTC